MYLKWVGNPSNVNVEIPLLKDSRLGERAIDCGKLFQTEIALGKNENLQKPFIFISLNLSAPRVRLSDWDSMVLVSLTSPH